MFTPPKKISSSSQLPLLVLSPKMTSKTSKMCVRASSVWSLCC